MLVQLEFIFHTTRISNTYMPMHLHDCYELVYYHSGEGRTRLDDTNYNYKKNSYSIIPPKTLHDEHRIQDTAVTFIGFTLQNKHFPIIDKGLFFDTISEPVIEKFLLEMNTEMNIKRELYPFRLNLLISEILIEHMRIIGTRSGDQIQDSLLFARKFIDENYNQKININDLSHIVGYSYDHFRFLFKKQFGISPISYVMVKRLDKARSLLRHSDKAVTAISMECGFSNTAQFCKIFKREVGEPPLSYRRSNFQTRSSKLN